MSVVTQAKTPPRAQMQPELLRIRVFEAAEAVAAEWDALEKIAAGSAYQSRRFLESWITNVAPATGLTARLALIEDEDGRPVALLPFGLSRRGPLRAVVYLGGRDSNLNMPLIDPALTLDRAAACALLRRLAQQMLPRPDLFILTNQPRTWRGHANPFAFEDAPQSPSAVYGSSFGADITAFLTAHESRDARKKHRLKAARLAQIGPLTFERAPPDRAQEIVATFLAQKESHLARRGILADLDNEPRRMFFNAVAAPASSEPVLEFYVLKVGNKIVAIFGGLPHDTHWHGLINSFDDEPSIARCSPGDLLLRHVLADLGQRGFRSFDLGIGEARYKAAVCDDRIELVDAIVPITPPGQMYAAAEALRLSAKRWVKQRPAAMKAVQTLRNVLSPRP